MIDLLITLIIFCIVFGLIYYLVMMLALPAPFMRIIQVAMILIAILMILSYLGGYLPEPGFHHRVITTG
jgi:hypothetical protein